MSEQTKPCEFCGYPNSLSARACEACGQPVRSAAQEPTVMVQRPAVEKPEMPPELKEALEPPASPPSPAEQTMPAYTPPPAPEPAKLRDIHQYPVVQPKPPQKKSKTGLIIVLILIGGLICLLAMITIGYFLIRNLTTRAQSSLPSLFESVATEAPALVGEATFDTKPLEATIEALLPEATLESLLPLATYIPELGQATPEKPSVLSEPPSSQMARDAVIVDDFETDVLGWADISDDISVHQYEEGAYTIFVKQPEYIAWTTVPVDFSPYYTDFEVWVPGGGEGGSYGVLCHFQNDWDYYYVEIDLWEQSYSIGRYLDDEYQPITSPAWPATSALKTGSAVNSVYVACELERITLFINDQFVEQIDLPAPAVPGEMAIFGSTWENMPAGGFKVYFDNFRAWRPVP